MTLFTAYALLRLAPIAGALLLLIAGGLFIEYGINQR